MPVHKINVTNENLEEILNRMDKKIDDRHKTNTEALKDINMKLNPIYETYVAWETIGRWGKAFLYVMGAILGLVVAWRQIFK